MKKKDKNQSILVATTLLLGSIFAIAIVINNIDVPQLGVRGRNSDNTLIKEKLSWSPTQPLRVGIKKTYEWIRSRYE